MSKGKNLFCLFLLIISLIYINKIFKDINIIDFVLKDNKQSVVINTVKNQKLSNSIEKPIKKTTEKKQEKTKSPLVYIYNTHETEEYGSTPYNIAPTVKTASNILKEELKTLGVSSILETRSITKEVNKRGLDYPNTYTVSFEYLKDTKKRHKTIKYFFDVHRDSVTGPPSVTTIKGKKYATMMFLVGTKNKNYQKNVNNLKIMESYLNKHYKNLVRNTYYQKHSNFNQGYSQNMFLVEIGGPENTLEEVYNTTKALSEAINYYIGVSNEK